ncbi:MAG: glycosyltransferase [Anaerolineales bacterium]|nr:glycosyltransferase [Anaerolineales bacterium]
MRILFLNHNVARQGGTYFRAFQAARHLAARGHAVTLLTISACQRWRFEREAAAGVDLLHTPDLLWGLGRTGWDPWDTARRLGWLRGRAWDIIHAWDSRPVVILPALFARRQSRRAGGKLFIDWCDWWGRGGTQAERPNSLLKRVYAPVETYFEEAFRTRADGSTAISTALMQRAQGLGVPATALWRLPQGCEVDALPLPARAEARRRLGLAPGRPVFVTVGAMTRSELALLFESLRRLFARRPETQFIMIGKPVEVPADLRQAPQFSAPGFLPEAALRDYMAASDALLTPLADTVASRARWPSKVNPFLAGGRATVITAVGDLAALLEAHRAGLVARCQPEDIVAQLERLVDEPGLREACERNALHLARGVLAWPKLAAQLEECYCLVRGEVMVKPAVGHTV